jgi:hypothetical protein
VVFLQIALGAAYRHDMTSVMPHMAVAMGVAFLALIVSSVVLQNFSRPTSLRRAAGVLISIVLTQVSLGITAFVLLVLNTAGTLAFVAVTVGHVAVGAATLASSVVMADARLAKRLAGSSGVAKPVIVSRRGQGSPRCRAWT